MVSFQSQAFFGQSEFGVEAWAIVSGARIFLAYKFQDVSGQFQDL